MNKGCGLIGFVLLGTLSAVFYFVLVTADGFIPVDAVATQANGFDVEETPYPSIVTTVYPQDLVYPFVVEGDVVRYGDGHTLSCQFTLGGNVTLIQDDLEMDDIRIRIERGREDPERQPLHTTTILPGTAPERGAGGWSVVLIDYMFNFIWIEDAESGERLSQSVLVAGRDCETPIIVVNFVQRVFIE